MVRRGDDDWFTIVKWLVYALIEAEEKGVARGNVTSMMGSQDPVVQRLLGVSGDMGTKLGLSNSWAVQAIQAVGNYGEIYPPQCGADRLATYGFQPPVDAWRPDVRHAATLTSRKPSIYREHCCALACCRGRSLQCPGKPFAVKSTQTLPSCPDALP